MNLITHLAVVAIFIFFRVNKCIAGNVGNAIDSYKVLSNIYTGYVRNESSFKRLTESLTNKQIKQNVAEELLCSYLYNGLYYVQLTRYIIEADDQSHFEEVLADKTYLFVEKAILQLTSMFNFYEGTSLNALWWIYMYTDYFKKIVGRVISYDQKTVKRFGHAVEDRLDSYINIFYQCKPNSMFNEAYDKSYCFNNINVVNNDINSLKLRWNFLGTMHSSFKHLLCINENYISMTSNREHFDIHRLQFDGLLKDKPTLTFLMKDCAKIVNWEKAIKKWIKDYKLALSSVNNIDRYIGIGIILSKLIALLKIIVLQILKKHLHYANYIKNNIIKIEQGFNFSQINNKISDNLEILVKLLSLNKDHRFNMVIYPFTDLTTNFFNEIHNNRNIDNITEYLDCLIKSLYDSQLTIVENYDCDFAQDSVKKILEYSGSIELLIDDKTKKIPCPFNDSLMSIQVFAQYVKRNFGSINFKVVQSFIEFSEELVEFQPRQLVKMSKSSKNSVGHIRKSQSDSSEQLRTLSLQRACSEPITRQWSRITPNNNSDEIWRNSSEVPKAKNNINK